MPYAPKASSLHMRPDNPLDDITWLRKLAAPCHADDARPKITQPGSACVQKAQRRAWIGISLAHSGHLFVVGSAGGSWWNR